MLRHIPLGAMIIVVAGLLVLFAVPDVAVAVEENPPFDCDGDGLDVCQDIACAYEKTFETGSRNHLRAYLEPYVTRRGAGERHEPKRRSRERKKNREDRFSEVNSQTSFLDYLMHMRGELDTSGVNDPEITLKGTNMYGPFGPGGDQNKCVIFWVLEGRLERGRCHEEEPGNEDSIVCPHEDIELWGASELRLQDRSIVKERVYEDDEWAGSASLP